MAPGDRSVPDSLRSGHPAPRSPKMDTPDYAGGFYLQSATAPPDGKAPYDSPTSIGGAWNTAPSPRSIGNGGDGTRSSEDRVGRRLEPGRGGSRERSRPRYQDRPTQRDRSRPNGRTHAKSPGSSSRICKRCGEGLTGQFVRALGATFHLECFKCEVSFLSSE